MSETVVTAKFVADTSSLQTGAQRVSNSLRGIDDGVRKTALSMNALKAGFLGVGAAVGMFAAKMAFDGIKAAAEQEKAIVRLSTALDNVGQGFRIGEVEQFVDDLQRATGVADDDLRPALQALVTATGNVTKAQDLLGLSLDISAATGRDLTAVSTALAKASNGQFMQINRLTNGAMNPAILATKDLSAVTAELERLYGGQAQASAETFAGKLQILKIAYDELLEAFGEGFIEGITEGADATTDMGNAFRAAEPGMREFGKTLGELGKIISYVSPFFDDVVNVFKVAIPSALASTAIAIPPLAPLISFIGTTFMGSKASVDAFANSVDIIGVKFTGPMSAAAQAATTSIGSVGDAAEEAAEEIAAMKAEFDMWLSVTNQITAVDKAAESIDNIGAASVEFGTNLMGQTPKARDFRTEVIAAFEDSAKAAQSLSDDLPTQRAIFTGELVKIVNALRASGVKPRDIEAFLGAMDGLPASVADIMRAAGKAIGDTNYKSQIEKAFDKSVKAGAPMTADTMEKLAEGASKSAKEKLGLTLEPQLGSIIKSSTTALRPTAFLNGQLTGKSIGSGLANGIQASSPIVQAAVERVIAQAKVAADAAAKSQSPSRLFAETGDDIGAGVAVGIARSGSRVNAAGQALVRNLMRAVNAALAPAMGPVQSAIADVFGNIPSVREAERALQDASWAVADARDAVVDAEKRLAEARKSGNAREIARAERDLARARRDVSDATAALRDAQKGLDLAKYIAQNREAVRALERLGKQFDYIVAKMEEVSGAFTELQDLTAKPFGQASQVARMFGSDTDIDGVISGYMQLRDVVTEAFGVLTDPKIVGAAAANANRDQMNATLGQLETLTAEAVQLREKYQANLQRIAKLEEDYQKEVTKINARYDALEAQGRENLAALEERLRGVTDEYERENGVLLSLVGARNQFLDRLGDSTRQFINNLSFPPPTTRTVREARRLANGILVTIDREITEGGDSSSIRTALEQRLNELRAFSANIKTLIQRGLDPALVQDFVSAGVSGAGDAVAQLAKGTDEELRAVNAVQSALGQEIAAFGAYAEQQWFAAGIAQQEAVVAPLQAQKDALTQSVADAKAALDQLAADRKAALDKAKSNFEAEKKVIEDENAALIVRMNQIAAEIETIITNLAATLPPRTVQAGQNALQGLLDGFRAKYPQVARDLGKLMDALAASLNRTITMTVRTVYDAGSPMPRRAMGGPVQARTAYLVGERGPEVFVPYGNGNIIPNHALGSVPSMGARAGGSGAGAVININVNAGMGADGAEIGRHIVDSLRQYERRNGPIPVSVTG